MLLSKLNLKLNQHKALIAALDLTSVVYLDDKPDASISASHEQLPNKKDIKTLLTWVYLCFHCTHISIESSIDIRFNPKYPPGVHHTAINYKLLTEALQAIVKLMKPNKYLNGDMYVRLNMLGFKVEPIVVPNDTTSVTPQPGVIQLSDLNLKFKQHQSTIAVFRAMDATRTPVDSDDTPKYPDLRYPPTIDDIKSLVTYLTTVYTHTYCQKDGYVDITFTPNHPDVLDNGDMLKEAIRIII